MSAVDLQVAAAVNGDEAALGSLAVDDASGAIGRRHRAASALYLQAHRRGVEGPAISIWRRDMVSLSARYIVFGRALERIASVLAEDGIGWIPLKGYDLATRVYEHAEERFTSDLDLLIAEVDFERAQKALLAAGWSGAASGPRARRYLAEEGYAWQAVDSDGVLLELHFRLWGSVPADLASAMVEAASVDSDLPTSGRRLARHHAYLAAAVHAWLSPLPRGIGIWRDLERLVATSAPSLVGEVSRAARRWQVQLPVALASEVAADLWDIEPCRRIASELESDLRWPERLMLWWARRRNPAQTSLALLTAARLLAARRTRHGWRLVWRRFWSHSGVVESSTVSEWPWIARRWWYQLTAMGWSLPAKWIEYLNTSGAEPVERGVER